MMRVPAWCARMAVATIAPAFRLRVPLGSRISHWISKGLKLLGKVQKRDRDFSLTQPKASLELVTPPSQPCKFM